MLRKQLDYLNNNIEDVLDLNYDTFVAIHSATLHNSIAEDPEYADLLEFINKTFNDLHSNLKRRFSEEALEKMLNAYFQNNKIPKIDSGEADFNDFLKILNEKKSDYLHHESTIVRDLISDKSINQYFGECIRCFMAHREYLFAS